VEDKKSAALAQVSRPVHERYFVCILSFKTNLKQTFNLILPIPITLSLPECNNQWRCYISNQQDALQILLFQGFHANNQSFDYTFLYSPAKLDDFHVARIDPENSGRKLLFILCPFFSNKSSIQFFLLSCGFFIIASIIFIAVKLFMFFKTMPGIALLMNEQIKWK